MFCKSVFFEAHSVYVCVYGGQRKCVPALHLQIQGQPGPDTYRSRPPVSPVRDTA